MILIGIGGNVPENTATPVWMTCAAAADALRTIPGLRRTALSRWYETEPVPPSGQPPYFNAVARLEGHVDPVTLLQALQTIELSHGRQRSVPDAARTLDLDIIAIGDMVRIGPDPILPHPRMHLRAFVLQPLLDVAPDWRHPSLGKTARALLAALPPQRVQVVHLSHLRDCGTMTN